MNEELQTEFAEEMAMTYDTAAKFGHSPSKFIHLAEAYGAVNAAKRLIISGDITNGLKRLKKRGRLDLAMESVMLKEKFQSLFSSDELAAARWRLNSI
jgi:hypothetical protein